MHHGWNAPTDLHASVSRHSPRRRSLFAALAGFMVVAASLTCGGSAGGGKPPVAAVAPGPAAASGSGHQPVDFGAWGAGYIAYAPPGQRFTAVRTRFVLPAATGGPSSSTPAWVAIWAGIGVQAPQGRQLMQAGVMLQASGGPQWSAAVPWWIDEPRQPVEPHPLRVLVSPGDEVEVSVSLISRSPQRWNFEVRDLSTGAQASGDCSDCSTRGRTAAWLVEDPSDSGAYTPYADPGLVRFTAAEAALDGGPPLPLSQSDWHPVLRQAANLTQGPLSSVPGPSGGFTVGRLTGRIVTT